MKKILIISYFWPYCAGSKRVFGLAKYLPLFGWQPVILTGPLNERPDPSFRVIETGYRGFLGSLVNIAGIDERMDVGDEIQRRLKKNPLRRSVILRFLYNKIKELLTYPDEHKNWMPFALAAAKASIKQERIDALLSIWPLSGHCVARALKEQYKLPWIADFPDLWSENAAYSYSSLRRWFDRRLEARTLKSADALTTSSDRYADKLRELHHGKLISSVLMGFDLDILNVPSAPLTKKFIVTYTGILYQGKRTPTMFFQALGELIREGAINPALCEARFYGTSHPGIKEEARRYGAESCVIAYPAVPLAECLQRQRESQVLLQLNWDDPKDKGVFSGKMLDYLAAMRPILAVGGTGNDIVAEWLGDTKAGMYCPSVASAKVALLAMYNEYRAQGYVSYKGDLQNVEKYNQKEMAKHFAALLDSMALL